jgi:5-methylcytosine-specific restriction protein A
MPTAPALPCSMPGCPERRPCPQHARVRQGTGDDWHGWYLLARWKHPGYGLRAQCLRRDPVCVLCRRAGIIVAATEADHVIPHRGDPRLFWDLGNLQGLCATCHGRKSAHEGGGGGA